MKCNRFDKCKEIPNVSDKSEICTLDVLEDKKPLL